MLASPAGRRDHAPQLHGPQQGRRAVHRLPVDAGAHRCSELVLNAIGMAITQRSAGTVHHTGRRWPYTPKRWQPFLAATLRASSLSSTEKATRRLPIPSSRVGSVSP